MKKRSEALDRLIVIAVTLLIFEFCAHFAFSLVRSSHLFGGITGTTEKIIYLVPFGVFLGFVLLYFIVRLFGALLVNLRAIRRH